MNPFFDKEYQDYKSLWHIFSHCIILTAELPDFLTKMALELDELKPL